MNQGDDWTAISGDLTNGGKKGNVAYGTLTTISESPFQFGLIYTGSDDGLVQVSMNGGGNWNNLTGLPKDLWVSRVIASEHKKERVYVALNGYRWDDFNAYVYMSDNYGQTWTDIGSSIPDSPVNVIREDSENENILYLGTDNGAYVSFHQGKSWEAFSKGLPNMAVHDIVVQPEAKDLLIGTHGRSIYKTDITELQLMNSSLKESPLTLFALEDMRHSGSWGSSWGRWYDAWEPEVEVSFYSNNSGEKTVKILSEGGAVLNQMTVDATKGFNYATYDLTMTEKGKKALLKENSSIDVSESQNKKYYLPKGSYTVQVDDEKTSLILK